MSLLAGRVPPPTPFLPTIRHDAAADESLLLNTGPVFDDMTLDEEDFLVPFGKAAMGVSMEFTTSTPVRVPRPQSSALEELRRDTPTLTAEAVAVGEEHGILAGPSRVRTLFSESPLLPPTDLTLGFEDESLDQLGAHDVTRTAETVGEDGTPLTEAQADVWSSTAWSAISAYASGSQRNKSFGADVSIASSSTSTSSRKRRRSPTPNRDDLFARRRRDSDRRSSRSKAVMIDSIVLPDSVAEGSSFRGSVSRSFASSSRGGRSTSDGVGAGVGGLAESARSAGSQNMDERSALLSSAVRDPARRVSGINIPMRHSPDRVGILQGEIDTAIATTSGDARPPARAEHRQIAQAPESAVQPRSVVKRLSGLLSSIIGSPARAADNQIGANSGERPSPRNQASPNTDVSQPLGDVPQLAENHLSDEYRPNPMPEPVRAQARSVISAPAVALPPGFRPLTRPAAPAFSTARRALQQRVHDEANRPDPRSVPTQRPATKSAFAAAALAKLPPPGRGSTPAARPVVLKPAERASNINARRSVFDKPGMRPPPAPAPAPAPQVMKRTVPLSGRTPGKASRLRAEQRLRAMHPPSLDKENTTA